MMLRLAIRNIARHKVRSIITMTVISLGGVGLIFTSGFFESVYSGVLKLGIHSGLGHLQLFADGYHANGRTRPFDYLIEDSRAIVADLAGIDGVRTVEPRFEFGAMLSDGEETNPIFIRGLPPHIPRFVDRAEYERRRRQTNVYDLGFILHEGRPMDSDAPLGILVPTGLQEKLGLSVGQELILLSRTVDDSLNGTDVVVRGVFSTGTEEIDSAMALLPLATAQRLLRTDAVRTIVVTFDKNLDPDKMIARIGRRLEDRGFDLEMRTYAEMADFHQKTVALFSRWVGIIKIVIAMIVILAISNTMNMSISDRTVEIGTLRALGNTRADVRRLMLCEGLLLGAIGGLMGAVAGFGLTSVVAAIGIPLPPSPGVSVSFVARPEIVPSAFVVSFALSVAASFIGSILPSFRAARLEIAHALRYTG